jgi:hypothetical protein
MASRRICNSRVNVSQPSLRKTLAKERLICFKNLDLKHRFSFQENFGKASEVDQELEYEVASHV